MNSNPAMLNAAPEATVRAAVYPPVHACPHADTADTPEKRFRCLLRIHPKASVPNRQFGRPFMFALPYEGPVNPSANDFFDYSQAFQTTSSPEEARFMRAFLAELA